MTGPHPLSPPSLTVTPPMSRSSSLSRRSPSLSIDLSTLPPLTTPSPPSNTLIITNLNDPTIFTPPFLAHLQSLIQTHAPAGVHSFAPLKSLRRIIVSFTTVDDATQIRSVLDGEALFGDRIRIYFGAPTPIAPAADLHLTAPKLDKQFFISPPPSPPAGWEIRHEDPPNKEVHAEDLATALEKLNARGEMMREEAQGVPQPRRERSNTGTIVYAPEDHGHSPDLPAIAVEDTTGDDGDVSPIDRKIIAHTTRPPLELM